MNVFGHRAQWCDGARMEVRTNGWKVETFFGLVLLSIAAGGCRSPQTRPAPPATAVVATRNNAASLLYDLLGDEKNVSLLLIIKRDRDELHRVIKDVSKTAATAHQTLERLAKEDASLDLKSTALPLGEKATREAEGKSRAGELLHASGADLEFKLLLTQAEALAYAENLAKVAAQNEPQSARAGVFRDLSAEMHRLHEKVLALLRSPSNSK